MNKLGEKKNSIYIIGLLYTLNALIVVLSAWAINLHQYDLSITISRYIGLRRWTAFMYIIVAGSMSTLAVIHITKIKMNIFKKILYILAFVCVFGCAVFPMNWNWSALSSTLHHVFSHTLMFSVTITFIWLLIKPVTKAQRLFAIVAIAYAVFFIMCFVIFKVDVLFNTLFIWENAFIYLFMAELFLEKSVE